MTIPDSDPSWCRCPCVMEHPKRISGCTGTPERLMRLPRTLRTIPVCIACRDAILKEGAEG